MYVIDGVIHKYVIVSASKADFWTHLKHKKYERDNNKIIIA